MGLKNYIRDKIHDFLQYDDYHNGMDTVECNDLSPYRQKKYVPNSNPTLTFRLHSGNGGYVMEFMSTETTYSEPSTESLYVIAESENLIETIDKLIMTEMLKR